MIIITNCTLTKVTITIYVYKPHDQIHHRDGEEEGGAGMRSAGLLSFVTVHSPQHGTAQQNFSEKWIIQPCFDCTVQCSVLPGVWSTVLYKLSLTSQPDAFFLVATVFHALLFK